MTTGYSERDGFVRLVMTKDDYELLVNLAVAGFLKAQQHGIRCAVMALETLVRVMEGDPGLRKTFPDLDDALADMKARVRMLDVLEEIAEVALAKPAPSVQ